jgi:hypothetical protein
MAMTSECLDCTISDNVIIGEMPPAEWVFREESRKKYGETHGVVVYGQGHVVSFNRVACFWDGIDIGGYYEPPDDPRKRACSIDFHNNHVSECMDDCIEMDYGVHNIRVYRNFLANALMGVSTQPLHGGPGYIFRNVIFNVSRAAFKLNCWPAGVLAYHNTCINPFAFRLTDMWQNSRLMNNVALGHEDVESGAIWTGTPTPETSLMDYNGYRDNGKRLLWSYARPRKQPDGRDLHHWVCRDLAEFARGSGQEAHGVWGVDYDAFVKAGPATGKHAASPDLDARLREGAKAIDRGARIPNFNDGFRGDAPDLGAVEFGEPLPRFGPRP